MQPVCGLSGLFVLREGIDEGLEAALLRVEGAFAALPPQQQLSKGTGRGGEVASSGRAKRLGGENHRVEEFVAAMRDEEAVTVALLLDGLRKLEG
jgi:hypothetical protein